MAVFTANRPEVMNAINHACQEDLVNFALWLEEAEHLRCAVITGAGDKAFVAGADINNLRSGTGLTSYKNGNMRRAFSALESCSKPVICAVNGWAMGGGFELALACDVRIASENARFGFPETDLGVLRARAARSAWRASWGWVWPRTSSWPGACSRRRRRIATGWSCRSSPGRSCWTPR